MSNMNTKKIKLSDDLKIIFGKEYVYEKELLEVVKKLCDRNIELEEQIKQIKDFYEEGVYDENNN